ncbi:hypothetical protein VDGL01_01914 [Verticillium dahliae]
MHTATSREAPYLAASVRPYCQGVLAQHCMEARVDLFSGGVSATFARVDHLFPNRTETNHPLRFEAPRALSSAVQGPRLHLFSIICVFYIPFFIIQKDQESLCCRPSSLEPILWNFWRPPPPPPPHPPSSKLADRRAASSPSSSYLTQPREEAISVKRDSRCCEQAQSAFARIRDRLATFHLLKAYELTSSPSSQPSGPLSFWPDTALSRPQPDPDPDLSPSIARTCPPSIHNHFINSTSSLRAPGPIHRATTLARFPSKTVAV